MTDYLAEYNRQYRQTHAIKIKKQRGQKHDCLCGGRFINANKARHFQSQKHNIRKFVYVTA